MRIARAAVLVGVVVSSSCAFVFQEKLPDGWKPKREPRCSATYGWAAWDSLIAGADVFAGGILLAGAASLPDDDYFTPPDEAAANDKTRGTLYLLAIIAGVDALAHGTSAGFGFHWASECEEARAAHDAWTEDDEEDEPAPPPPPARWEDRGVPPPLPDAELADAGAPQPPAAADAGMSLPE